MSVLMYHGWKMLSILLALFALRYETVRKNSDVPLCLLNVLPIVTVLLYLWYEFLLAYFRIWVHRLVSSLYNVLFHKTVGQYIEQILNIAKCFCTCKAILSHKFSYTIHSSWVAKGFPSFFKNTWNAAGKRLLTCDGQKCFSWIFQNCHLIERWSCYGNLRAANHRTTNLRVCKLTESEKILILMAYFYQLNNEEQIQDLLRKSVFPWRNLDLGFSLNNIKYSYYKISSL